MSAFRYQAIAGDGAPVNGVIEADDRRSALQLLGRRGLYPSQLESSRSPVSGPAAAAPSPKPLSSSATTPLASPASARISGWPFGGSVRRKDITAFSRQMASLVGASIPIPQALEGLGDEEENPNLRAVLRELSSAVRTGASFSGALAAQPRHFSSLYVSMVRVGEEAGALPGVMNDLADLLENEAEVQSEVVAAVSYPLFVLTFGILTVVILITVVLPKLFTMLQEMIQVLPLPTLILLSVSGFFNRYWWVVLLGGIGGAVGLRAYIRTAAGAEMFDFLKLRIPILGGMFRAAALGRFARTLGTLVKSGISLLPALKIVEATIGNLIMARQIAQAAEETRSGASLAGSLRKLGIFPKSVIQMIAVGEETGKLDEMLLKVALIEERHLRSRTKTVISLLAPILILAVGALVGFMVLAILLPIFKMSRGFQ